MRTALFYDTETTGLPLFSEPSEDPRQPHLVQLAACLVDLDTRATIASIDLLIAPTDWVISPEISEIHGITHAHALRFGMPESAAVDVLMHMWSTADCRIGHNQTFDARILRIALMRHQSAEIADEWQAGVAECTQILATPICKMPPTAKMVAARRTHHKSANLGEAFNFFTGSPLVGAHNAMVDVQACMTVYFAIKDRELEAA